MALFKILKGPEKKDALGNSVMLSGTNGAPPLHEGWAYVTDEGNLYVDLSDKKRVKINQNADFAIKAMYDALGQEITDTYIKNITYNKSASTPTYTIVWGNNDDAILTIPVANTTDAGIITAGAATDRQVFSGTKRFAHSVIVDQTILQAARAGASNASNLFKITLPAKFKNEMLVFDVVHRSYGKVARWTIEAYLYGSSNRWHMPSVAIVTNYDAAYTTKIKFGYDSNNNPIIFFPCFGTYSQVYVENVHCGFASLEADYYKGWKIEFCSTTSGTIQTEVAPKLFASYDEKNQSISSTYVKGMALVNSATQPSYTLTKGDNTVISVNTPIASATTAGNITTGSQTLTGAKTLDTKGSLIIQKSNGFTYTGIESENGNSYRPVWFARSDKNGTPVYNANFTYNPNTATLKVANLDGLAAKATADGNGDNIRSTYVKNLGLTTNKYGITYQKGDGTEATISPYLAASGSNGGSALSADRLVDHGTHAEVASNSNIEAWVAKNGMLYDSGMYMTRTYNDPNTPCSYGNIINVAGGGAGQLLLGWATSNGTTTGNIYYRDQRDCKGSGDWHPWKQVAYTDGTIANATKAEQDASGQVITATYIKKMALVNSATQPTYTLTRGDNTTFNVNTPIASATNAGNITTGTQTITGAKTIDANGSLTIAKGSGFIYSGIETAGDTTDGDRQVWVAHGSTKGIPVLSGANFTYNSKTKTLKVSHIIGEITKAISDTLNQQIDKTYIKNITLIGHATQPYLVLTKGDNTTSNLNLPIASTTAAGLITNAAQTIAGDKTFTGQILKKGVSSSWIGGRTNALVRMTEIHGYSPFASIKTTNGSWEIGAYDQSSYTDDLVFSYCTDANFNAGSNSTSAQIKFLENGHIVAALDGRATQALQDSQGQQINTTYLKNMALVNHATLPKYTITKGDGNTFDVNLPVANESNAGVITNTTQALAGNKSLKGSLSTTENITTAKQLISNIATGTSPLKVTSTTVVTNLNADTVDGMHASNNSFTQTNASDTTLPTQLAIWNSLNSLLISAQALVYRGTLTPAQFKALSASGVNRGDVFVVSAEGSFGGKYCEPGDMLICYDKTSTAVTWDIVQTNIDGSVIIKGGGAAATVHADVHAIARFDSNTGRVIDNSKVFIDDNGYMTAKATETQDIGTSDNKWRTIYAKSFNGLATNATADSSGQNIMDTYIKDWTLTKHATQPFVTLTKGNGNTSDINLPIAGQNDAGLITNAAQTIYGVKTFNTSIIAKSDHDFISHGNEFNVIPKLSANIAFNFNYHQKDGNGAGKITQYNFCNGAGGILASISQGQFSGNAATATKATQDSTGQQINTTYIKSVRLVSGTNPSYEFTRGDNTAFSVNVPISDLDGHYVKKTGDTMSGTLIMSGITTGSWTEGIRVNDASNGWTTILLGGNLTSGHSAATWSLHTKDGNFYLTHDGYNSSTTGMLTSNASGTWTIKNSLGVNGADASYALYVNGNSKIDGDLIIPENHAYYGILGQNSSTAYNNAGGLTWFNIDGKAGCAANVNDTPTTAWWYILRNRHTNTGNNYYTDVAIPFNANSIYYKCVMGNYGAESIQSNKWIKVLDELNISYVKVGDADTVDGYHASSLWRSDGATWNGGANISCSGDSTEWSFDINSTGGNSYWHVWSSNQSRSMLACYPETSHVSIPIHLYVGGYNHTGYALSTSSFICDSWIRTTGSTGWYNETYGGGWFMQDSTFIRNYNSKHVYITGRLGVDCELRLWNNTRQITRNSRSVAWVNGRDSALIRESNADGWHALTSVKTSNGSWEMGEYNLSGWANYLVFSYVSDSDYNSGTNRSTTIRFRNNGVVESAMWNDYAECRNSLCTEPGRVVYELGDDRVDLVNTRLAHFAGVVSDTYGYIEGETEDAHTPLAVSGRVLVYPYQNRNNYKPGDCVCAAPGGTVDIMTREEIIQYPDRIVGTVSCVPEYEKWGTGNVKVNGRIWIKVR